MGPQGLEDEPGRKVPNGPERLDKVDQAPPPSDRAGMCANVGRQDDSQDDSPSRPISPRARLVAALTETISAATAAGDLHAARVAHEAIGRLLEEPEPGVAGVADLRAERSRRGESG